MIPDSFSILVVSDSHGNVDALAEALAWAQLYSGCSQSDGGAPGKTPALSTAVFLGDGEDDLDPASARAGFILSWNIVRGNVDMMNFSHPGAMVLEISGRKLFLTHGNAYGVGEDCKALAAAAKTNGAEAALFGHTHVPSCAMLDGIFLLNPGSIGRPRSNVGPTFAVLECPPTGPLNARFFGLVKRGNKSCTVQELKL